MQIIASADEDTKVSFYSKKNSTRSVFVEGYANRYQENGLLLVDRGNDLIDPKGWEVNNFASNAVILFNHDRDNPVGRAVKIETNDDGLFVKAKLSDSDHPEISRIRDLVKDGVLRAFSVGFDPKLMAEETIKELGDKKVNVIKSAELLEISIVSLPMAERSLFQVSAKQLASLPYSVAYKACRGELNILEDDGMAFTNECIEVVNNVRAKAEAPAEPPAEPPAGDGADGGVDSQPSEAESTSPLLDQIKQTNVLLATLINEVKLMSKKMDVVEEEPAEEPAPNSEAPPEGDAPAEMGDDPDQLKNVSNIWAECDRILRKHGI